MAVQDPEQPPQQPSQSQPVNQILKAAAAGQAAKVAVGVAATPAVTVTLPGRVAAAAAKVPVGIAVTGLKIAVALRILRALFRRHHADSADWLTRQLRSRYPNADPAVIREAVAREMQYEIAFQQKALTRVQDDLNAAAQLADDKQQARINAIIQREQHYSKLRQQAMMARATAHIENSLVKAKSPGGAVWMLGDRKNHTRGCLALAGKAWPWSVLDAISPPIHTGCGCWLKPLGPGDKVPEAGQAARDASAAMALEEAIRSVADAGEIDTWLDGQPVRPSVSRALRRLQEGQYEEALHPRGRGGKWIGKLFKLHEAGGHMADAVTAWRDHELKQGTNTSRNEALRHDAPSRDVIAGNWTRQLRGRLSKDREAIGAVAQANAENRANPRWRKFTEGMPADRVIVSKKANDKRLTLIDSAPDMAHRAGGTTIITDRSVHIAKDYEQEPKKPTHETKPAVTAGYGLAAVLRHEYGHSIDDMLGREERRHILNAIPNVADDLSYYGSFRDQEVLPELIATITHPDYHSKDWPESVQEAERRLLAVLHIDHLPEKSNAPGTGWEGHPALASKIKDTTDKLLERFPIPFKGVNVTPLADEFNQLAGKSNDSIHVSPKFLDDAWMTKHMKDWSTVSAQDKPEDVVVHEFGHVLDGWLLRHHTDEYRSQIAPWIRAPVTYTVGGKDVSVPRWQAGDGENVVSAYSNESPYEFFAEAFTDWFLHGEKAKPRSRELGALIDKVMGKPLQEADYAEALHPRGRGGEWTRKLTHVIAIDGPAASGKSTVARKLAQRLGGTYIDTGAHYRAAGLAMSRGIDPVAALRDGRIRAEGSKVLLDGEDITGQLRTPQADAGAAELGGVQEVRDAVGEGIRRQLDDGGTFVADGRDAGRSLNADQKIFLTASPQARAERRAESRGMTVPDAKVAIEGRDQLDAPRIEQAKANADHVHDSSSETQNETVARLLGVVEPNLPLQEAHFIEWLHPRGRGGEWIRGGIHHYTSAPEPGVAPPAVPRVGENFTGEDFAKAMDGFQHAGIVAVRSGRTKTQNLYGEVWLNLQKVGEIEPVGLARVTLKPPNLRGERHAELSNIYLRGSEQGNGFGAAFTNHFLDTLRHGGVDVADVEAVSVGGYAWARRGFVWSGDKHATQRQILADAKKDGRFKQIASRASEQTMTELERKLTAGEFGSEAELAGWGRDHWWWETPPERHDYTTGTGPPKTRNWPGKELMIGSHWKGALALQPQAEPEPQKWPEPEQWQTQGFGAREPSDEGEFKTQMQSAREFANKAFTSSGMTTDEQWALSSYQASGFVHVNEFLRDLNPEVTRDSPSAWYSTPPSGATVGQMIDRLDSAIAKSTLKENVTVYRGGPVGQFADLNVGDEVRDPAFVSTSLRSPIAARPGDEVTSIRLPAGIHAFAFEEGLHIGGGSGLPESEVLLPRNTTFRIAEVNEDQWGNRSVILEALPPQAQDVR